MPPSHHQPKSSAPLTALRPFTGYLQGLGAPLAGLAFLAKNSKLWRYAVVPFLLNLLVTILVFFGLIAGVAWFSTYVHSQLPAGWWGWLLEIVAIGGMLLLAVGLAAGTWFIAQSLLCEYFYGELAKQVELQLGTQPSEMRDLAMWLQARDALRKLVYLLLVNGAFLFVNCVPVIGTVIALYGMLYFDSYLFGSEFLDYPLSLRGMRGADKRQFIRLHRFQTLGLGTVVLLVSFIPIVGAVLLTTAVVGAVLLQRKLEPTAAQWLATRTWAENAQNRP